MGQTNSLPINSDPILCSPLVSVICICYNHQDFVLESLQSVINQTYSPIELIVIDNGSTDQSVEYITKFIQQHPTTLFIKNPVNLGLTRAFNQGLQLARGQFIIDLSADDVFLPTRIAKQVLLFNQLPNSYGVIFSNAAYINTNGQQIGFHYPVDSQGRACKAVPTGHVFKDILKAYFICSPTMMIRRNVLTQLGGYDESLFYEDFDFWVRSSKYYQYAYQDEILTLKRQLSNSLSAQISLPSNSLLLSTYIVCRKAYDLCETSDEYRILANRIQTFIRKAFYVGQFDLAGQFGMLLYRIAKPDQLTCLILVLSRLQVPINRLYRLYIQFRRKPR
ncbi:hypothetical protein GCM10028805_47580 [Spirosoma harenae]